MLPHLLHNLVPASRYDLLTSSGRVIAPMLHWLRTYDPCTRFALLRGDGNRARLVFRYHGPTDKKIPLASGRIPVQIGLKLRAQDSCNVLYVMWCLEPEEKIVVSIKRNPGLATHKECGARGYAPIQTYLHGFPLALDGSTHELAAELSDHGDYCIDVWADDVALMPAVVEPELLTALAGTVGFRSDNCRAIFQLFADISL